jgi:hypothetical protein
MVKRRTHGEKAAYPRLSPATVLAVAYSPAAHGTKEQEKTVEQRSNGFRRRKRFLPALSRSAAVGRQEEPRVPARKLES